MSDPMTNTEVEDVLASIRRLVSDDKRPETEAEATASSDRLVLTPSLRVMEPEAKDAEPDDVDVSPEPDMDATSDPETDKTPETDEAPDQDKAPDQDDAFEGAQIMQAVENIEAVLADDDRDVVAEQPSVDIEQMSIHEAFAAEDAPEEVEDHDANAATEDVAEPEADDASGDVEVDAAPEHEDDADIEDLDAQADSAPQGLSEKIAALETLIGKRSEEFEPDEPGTDAYAGTEPPTMAWEDADEAPAYAAYTDAQRDAPEPDLEEAAQIFSSDEDVLDEEALRDLVSDIVRQELQGALGERITRNVRKLVRREIHRALAAQELD
ncbi:hypothetical protein [uncultured Tateyamaria sp.]|uniref:hypothetical protein n=1 Tax=uncultured Tateyamaria sp. TaxID=455651 RepID=UPI00263245FF|nr:hypothetical protein [uncultured Tateyamaria sp.]